MFTNFCFVLSIFIQLSNWSLICLFLHHFHSPAVQQHCGHHGWLERLCPGCLPSCRRTYWWGWGRWRGLGRPGPRSPTCASRRSGYSGRERRQQWAGRGTLSASSGQSLWLGWISKEVDPINGLFQVNFFSDLKIKQKWKEKRGNLLYRSATSGNMVERRVLCSTYSPVDETWEYQNQDWKNIGTEKISPNLLEANFCLELQPNIPKVLGYYLKFKCTCY